jgi:hypothetical protein
LALAKTYQMKSELLEIIHQKISEKIQKLEQLIAETRASITIPKVLWEINMKLREMLQQEINNLQIQLNEHLSLKIFKKHQSKSSQNCNFRKFSRN